MTQVYAILQITQARMEKGERSKSEFSAAFWKYILLWHEHASVTFACIVTDEMNSPRNMLLLILYLP